MTSTFSKYDHFIAEVQARDPEFFAHHPLHLDAESLAAALAQGEPGQDVALNAALNAADSQALARELLAHWQEMGLQFATPSGAPADETADPVAQLLLGSVRDQAMLEQASPAAVPDVARILETGYDCVTDANGKNLGWVRKQGNMPLVLINALGIPLRIWGKLLSGTHDYRIIVPAFSSCDPVEGGMLSNESVPVLANQVQAMLERLALAGVHVLAWCNGGRIGLQLLAQCPERIGQLILLAPTLRGGEYTGPGNPFEDNLDRLFGMVRSSHKRARAVAAMLGQAPALPDWKALPDAASRGAALLGMPRREYAADLSKPMAEPGSLIHYVERTDADEAVTAGFAARVPAGQIVLVHGENDGVVHNLQARQWLAKRVGDCPVFQIAGAGHYIQDLQYPYLLQLLGKLLLDSPGSLSPRIQKINQN